MGEIKTPIFLFNYLIFLKIDIGLVLANKMMVPQLMTWIGPYFLNLGFDKEKRERKENNKT